MPQLLHEGREGKRESAGVGEGQWRGKRDVHGEMAEVAEGFKGGLEDLFQVGAEGQPLALHLAALQRTLVFPVASTAHFAPNPPVTSLTLWTTSSSLPLIVT